MSIAKRAIPDATSIEEANQIVRGNWLNAIEEHHLKYSGNRQINDILDIGCSVGVSTRYLAQKFPSAQAVVSSLVCLSSGLPTYSTQVLHSWKFRNVSEWRRDSTYHHTFSQWRHKRKKNCHDKTLFVGFMRMVKRPDCPRIRSTLSPLLMW
jgi:hypothetical protein